MWKRRDEEVVLQQVLGDERELRGRTCVLCVQRAWVVRGAQARMLGSGSQRERKLERWAAAPLLAVRNYPAPPGPHKAASQQNLCIFLCLVS